jgi:hypothetical protein
MYISKIVKVAKWGVGGVAKWGVGGVAKWGVAWLSGVAKWDVECPRWGAAWQGGYRVCLSQGKSLVRISAEQLGGPRR